MFDFFSGLYDALPDVSFGLDEMFGGGGTSGIGPVADGDTYGSMLEGGGGGGGFSWSKDIFKPALGSLISAAPGLFTASANADMQEAALKRQAENDKLNAMLELAKLKYGAKGGGGGGGGDPLARQKLMIETKLQSAAAKSSAYQALQNAFAQIYGS